MRCRERTNLLPQITHEAIQLPSPQNKALLVQTSHAPSLEKGEGSQRSFEISLIEIPARTVLATFVSLDSNKLQNFKSLDFTQSLWKSTSYLKSEQVPSGHSLQKETSGLLNKQLKSL